MPDLVRFFLRVFSVNKPLICLITYIALTQPCNSADTIKPFDFDVYSTISGIEKQVYNKEYTQENFYPRLERLEKSVLNFVYKDSIYNRLKRLQDVLSVSKSTKIQDNRQVILDLLENRYFGFNYKEDPLGVRLTRLEECLFDRAIIGNIDFRFENLAKQMPAVSQQNFSQSMPLNPPEHKKEWKEYTSFADINLDNSDLDYFSNIQKSNSRKLLRWESFPILVYIYPESDNHIQTAIKAVQIWSEYIQINLVDNPSDANIMISWKKNYTDITMPDKVEHVLYSKDNKTKVYIYCGRFKDTTYLDKFLVHQIGHSLGIWGHSKDKNDIMYPFKEFRNDINYKDISDDIPEITINSASYRPTTRDINTLIRIYNPKK